MSTPLNPSIHQFAAAVIEGMDTKPMNGNGWSLDAWVDEEIGNVPVPHFNGLNTKYKMSCSFSTNDAGVQGYYCLACGVMATVRTLTNGDYPTLVEAIQTNNADLFFSEQGRAELGTWSGDSTGAYANEVYAIYQQIVNGELTIAQ